MVKTVENGPPDLWKIHARVKRGGGFNTAGALGWEWFDLRVTIDDSVVIMWRGAEPPKNHGYESLPGLGVTMTMDGNCNTCHAAAARHRLHPQPAPARTAGPLNVMGPANRQGPTATKATAIAPMAPLLLISALLAATGARAQPAIELPPETTETRRRRARPRRTAAALTHPDPAITLPPVAPAAAAPVPPVIVETAAPGPIAMGATTVGGYGQIDLKYRKIGPDGPLSGQANVRRIVLFVGHQWTERLRTTVELEWENAVACAACQGVAEVEQAFVDAALWGQALTLRAGLILVPMGIINQYHEPPVFHGVDRPSFDQSVLPSTWREIGVGFTGRFKSRWRYELYAMTAIDPVRLGPDGFVGARASGSLARADALAGVGRLEVEPVLGALLGISGYASDTGPNGDFFNEAGRKLSLRLPLLGWSFDARVRRWGFEARAVAAQFFLPESGRLLAARRADGSLIFPDPATSGPVPTRTQGGYVEVAYDLIRLFTRGSAQQLLPFVRAEYYNTQAAVPDGFRPVGRFNVQELTIGLTYRPILQLAAKADLQLRDRRFGLDEYQINFGFGWMF